MEAITDHEILRRISSMSPNGFENMTLDLLRAAGFRNIVWRTPGADGGRDIEAEQIFTDISGIDIAHKWYIECKRYSSSIDWPTIWKKISYADSHNADILFLVTNSQPSPQCESEIRNWNEARRRPGIRVWRGYDLPMRLRCSESVAVAHGIAKSDLATSSLAIDFALVLSKLVQAAYSASLFNKNSELPLTSASALAELFHQRMESLSTHGRFVSGAQLRNLTDWPWLSVSGQTDQLEEVGFRAIVSTIRHVLQADQMNCIIECKTARISANSAKRDINASAQMFLSPILQWSLCDSFLANKEEIVFSFRGTEN